MRASFIAGLALAAATTALSAAAPNASYAPYSVTCPNDLPLFRCSQGLNPHEAAWVRGRKRVVYDSLAAYLKRLHFSGFDLDTYLNRLRDTDYSQVPIISYSVSGGGVASAYTGTGGHTALDDRNKHAILQRTGGLLQSLTYYTGQSGGTWPALGFAFEGLPKAQEILRLWTPWDDIDGNTTLQEQAGEYVDQKYKAGFNVSVSDYLGILMAAQYAPGKGLDTYSGLLDVPFFSNHSIPMPFYQVSDVIPQDTEYLDRYVPAANGTATLYEATPFEFGSWGGDGQPVGFIPTEYLGTPLKNGHSIGNKCVHGFDRLALMFGTSATAVNFWDIEYFSNGTLGSFSRKSKRAAAIHPREPQGASTLKSLNLTAQYDLDEKLYSVFKQEFGLNQSSVGYAVWPNPYRGIAEQPEYYRHVEKLRLVDATETGQAIPLWGLIQPARKTDFMFAWDDDEDAENGWSNGTNIRDVYVAAAKAGLPFPKVPTVDTIINRGYNLQPTFFGCEKNLTTNASAHSPIVAYITNSPYSSYTNYSFQQPTFKLEQMEQIFNNSFNILTAGNGSLDNEWPECLGCAVIERSRERLGITRSEQCNKCFEKYCWDGTEDKGRAKTIDPSLRLAPGVSFKQWLASGNPF